jgi:hypothetical protein
MKLRYALQIDDVDGETRHHKFCTNAKEALKFLGDYDHEGHVVSVMIEAIGEDVYTLLIERDGMEHLT